MSKKTSYSFNVDGLCHEVNYYLSETPIDVNSPPAPKLTINGSLREFTDTTLDLDKVYHARLSSKTNTREQFRNEFLVYAASNFQGSPYLISTVNQNVAYDWSASSSDYAAGLALPVGWLSTDYIIAGVYSKSAVVTPPSGFALLYSKRHTTNSSAYLHIFGGLKGGATTLNFTLGNSGPSCFGISAMAVSNIDQSNPLVDVIYSEQSGLNFNSNIRNASSDGLFSATFCGFDSALQTITFSPANTYSQFGVWSNASDVRGIYSFAQPVADFLTKSKSAIFSASNNMYFSIATVFLRRKAGARDVLTLNKTALQTQISASKGYAYAIIKNGEPFEIITGGKEKEGGNTFSANTVMPIGSISKVITEVAVRRLVEGGVLGLDNTIGQYFPDIPLGTNVANIKIRNLLEMKAGLGTAIDITTPFESTTKAWLSNSASNVGLKYMYHNGNFSVLQMIINRLAPDGYISYVQQNIFKPLGIYDAKSDPTGLEVKMYSEAFVEADLVDVKATAAAGWCMSLNSLIKLSKALRYPVILNSSSIKEMKEDRYRFSQTNSIRGEMWQHDGNLVSGLSGLRTQYLHGCDDYDIIAMTNTNLSQPMISACRTVIS